MAARKGHKKAAHKKAAHKKHGKPSAARVRAGKRNPRARAMKACKGEKNFKSCVKKETKKFQKKSKR